MTDETTESVLTSILEEMKKERRKQKAIFKHMDKKYQDYKMQYDSMKNQRNKMCMDMSFASMFMKREIPREKIELLEKLLRLSK